MMHVNYPPTAVRYLIEDLLVRIDFARNIGRAALVKSEMFDLYNNFERELIRLKSEIEGNHYSTEYANDLAKSLDKLVAAFPRSYGTDDHSQRTLQDEEVVIFRNQQERDQEQIELALANFADTRDFFSKIGFFSRDLVIVGSNGSGKTFLAGNLMSHAKNNGVVVAARRILYVPTFDNVKSRAVTVEELKSVQISDKSNRLLDLEKSQGEFGILIQHLLAEDVISHKEYKRKAGESARQGIPIEPPKPTKLEVALQIWNELFNYSHIFVEDEMNIMVHSTSGIYGVNSMSDGEKVALFLVIQVLQCPDKGFIIVDEPEMHLHPTIHRRLWDRLEAERPDAIFAYLTHDLDFATSRVHAKKLWLRSFQHATRFELEEIPCNEIPQNLLLELLGARQEIIFCEGQVGSLDERIYGILFPNYAVRPVGGCLSVISYTKAFNKLPMSTTRAIGVIDGDFISQKRRESLLVDNVFCIEVPDVENLLLDRAMLVALCEQLTQNSECVATIESNILVTLAKDTDVEIAKYVSAKVDHYFKDSNVASAKNIADLELHYDEFVGNVNIESWAHERRQAITKVLDENDYQSAVRMFKNKKLDRIVEFELGLDGFIEIAINLLESSSELQAVLRKNIAGIA
jgi:ABC-type cobalamin/Fe3+-siderophores transport system ATPase subunit